MSLTTDRQHDRNTPYLSLLTEVLCLSSDHAPRGHCKAKSPRGASPSPSSSPPPPPSMHLTAASVWNSRRKDGRVILIVTPETLYNLCNAMICRIRQSRNQNFRIVLNFRHLSPAATQLGLLCPASIFPLEHPPLHPSAQVTLHSLHPAFSSPLRFRFSSSGPLSFF